MRSDNWDENEKKPFSGFMIKEDDNHTHDFHDSKCVYCGKTREQIRNEWR